LLSEVAEQGLGVKLGLVEIFAATAGGVYRPVLGGSVTFLLTTAVVGRFLLGCVLLSCVLASIGFQGSLHLDLYLLIIV
jgi:hypothetical protein